MTVSPPPRGLVFGAVTVAVALIACAAPIGASATVLTLSSSGVITYAIDPGNLFGLGAVIQNVPYTAIAQYDTGAGALDVEPYSISLEGGTQYGYASLGYAAITINGFTGVVYGDTASKVETTYGGVRTFTAQFHNDYLSPTGRIYDTLNFAVDRTDDQIPENPTIPYVGNYCSGAVGCLGTFSLTRSDPRNHVPGDEGLPGDYLSYVAGRFQQTYVTVNAPINTPPGHYIGPIHFPGVPEPKTWAVLMTGLFAVGAVARARARTLVALQ